MFIHIGNKISISEKNIMGVFNSETLKMSEINEFYYKDLKDMDKTIVIDNNNNIMSSNVSPFTIITRNSVEEKDCFWRKK